jgi:hypothetical protein
LGTCIGELDDNLQCFMWHSFLFCDFSIIYFLIYRTCVKNSLHDFSISLYLTSRPSEVERGNRCSVCVLYRMCLPRIFFWVEFGNQILFCFWKFDCRFLFVLEKNVLGYEEVAEGFDLDTCKVIRKRSGVARAHSSSFWFRFIVYSMYEAKGSLKISMWQKFVFLSCEVTFRSLKVRWKCFSCSRMFCLRCVMVSRCRFIVSWNKPEEPYLLTNHSHPVTLSLFALWSLRKNMKFVEKFGCYHAKLAL